MLRSLFKLELLLSSKSNNGVYSRTTLLLRLSPASRPFSSPFSASASDSDSVEDYLVNKLSLSQKAAKAFAAAKFFETTETLAGKSDPVVALFREYGFTTAHISNIVVKYPCVLIKKPEANLRPKLDFLSKNGFSGQHLVDFFSREPQLCGRSLSNKIIPCVTFFREFFGSTRDAVEFLKAKRGVWVLRGLSESVVRNIECLRKHQVPESNIVKMMKIGPRVLIRDCDEFSEFVKETIQMGYRPQDWMFLKGLYTLSSMKKDKWVSKLEIFQSYGWTEEELKAVLVKQPIFISMSEDRIKKTMDLFINKLGWSLEEISRYPTVLCLSIERRILPRAEVVNVLVSNGLLKSKVGRPFIVSEDNFLKKYVIQYLEELPQLLEIYKKNMGSVIAVAK